MGFREVCLFLSIFLATSTAAVDQQSYIIHMDTTKMAAPTPEQWYTALIDSINEISSLHDQQEASNAAQILYVYKTAISGNIFNINVGEKNHLYYSYFIDFQVLLPSSPPKSFIL